MKCGVYIHYDMPLTKLEYLYRMGRTGKFGNKGLSIAFMLPGKEADMLNDIRKFFNTEIDELPLDFADLL